MRLVVLVCAVTLLVCPPASCVVRRLTIAQHSLYLVFDLTEQCSASLSGTYFVEDVSDLTEGRNRCQDKFFCKVQEILGNLHSTHFCEKGPKLVETLKMYNRHRNVNCTEAVEGMTRAHSDITVAALMKNLIQCIRQRNLRGTK